MGMTDVAVRDEDIQSLCRTQVWARRREFDNLLPATADVDTFAGLTAAAMFRAPALAVAAMQQPESLIIALRDCARLGHMPGTDEYALTVRGGGVLGIEQYQGVVARMFNGGCVRAVHAEVVAQGETLTRRDPLPPLHTVPGDDWLGRDLSVDNLKGAYAYAILDGGACSRVVIMGRQQIMTHRDKAGKKNDWSPFWDGPFGLSMWLKTPTHELEKWVPTSATYRQEQARANAAYAQLTQQTPQVAADGSTAPGPDSPMGGPAADGTGPLSGSAQAD